MRSINICIRFLKNRWFNLRLWSWSYWIADVPYYYLGKSEHCNYHRCEIMEHQAKDASIHLCGESFLKNSYLVGKIFVGKMLKHVLSIFDSTTTYIFDKGIGDLTLRALGELRWNVPPLTLSQ